MTTVGISELVDVCRTMERRSTALFEALGAWVPDEHAPAAQRLFAEACHRHAWHADLWRERTPAIPAEPAEAFDTVPVPTAGRLDWYRDELGELRAELDALRTRIDPDLDPSTSRTVTLVDADLADLHRRASSIS